MRIAFSGAACTGKTTTIKAFLEKWPNYKLINSDYRKLVRKEGKHSKSTTSKIQKQILDILCNDAKPYTLHDKVVYDRCPLDNLVYSLWCHGKNKKGFSDKFIAETIGDVKESMRNLDIIFVCSRKLMSGPIVNDGLREVDETFVSEIDNLFLAISRQAQDEIAKSPFFVKDDSPGVIDIHGTTEERMAQIALYVTPDGDAFGEEQSILNLDEIAKMKGIIEDQKELLKQDEKQIFKM
jgi:hypothetical protein